MTADAAPPMTILDIAQRAGVSKTTASDALSGTGRVSEQTRRRVQAIAEELGYTPSSAARHLRGGRTGTVGLYLPQMTTSVNYYMQFTYGAVERAREAGYDLTLYAPSPQGGTSPGRPRVDGIVLIDPLPTDTTAARLAEGPVPVVTGERNPRADTPPQGVVRVDHEAVIDAILDHLHERGARRPVLLAPDVASDWDTSLRHGFTTWCTRTATVPHVVAVPFDATPDQTTRAVRELLEASPDIDAIVCAPDEAALGVPGAALAAGRTVGADLLLASCVDSPAMALSSPRITAVDLQPRRFGRACTELLIDLVERRAQPGEERLQDFELILRASTAGMS